MSKNKQTIMMVQHVNGTQAKISPPLDTSYTIKNNNNDQMAVACSTKCVSEVPILKLFEAVGKLEQIPRQLHEERVGMPADDHSQIIDRAELLELCDGRPDDAAVPDGVAAAVLGADESPPGSGSGRSSSSSATAGRVPSGTGISRVSEGPPKKKS